jgi:hypothetical protein
MKRKLPAGLIRMLGDKRGEAKLRTICYRLKEKGDTVDYITGEKIPYLNLVYYGVDGIPFNMINELFEK